MKYRNSTALGTAALLVAVSLAGKPAHAFDSLDWSWTNAKGETASNDVKSWLWAFPDGQTAVNGMQMMVGGSQASATVDAQVTPPDADGTTTATAPNDSATDFPVVVGTAGAYGNAATVESEVPISTQLGQYHVGGYDATAAAGDLATTLSTLEATGGTAVEGTGGNANRQMLDEINKQAMMGLITPHQTSANVEALGVVDTGIDIEARAVSNSASLGLEATSGAEPAVLGEGGTTLDGGSATANPLSTNAVLTADVTQYGYGDVAATARSGQTIANFSGLATLSSPVARVGATAIGNLTTTTVGIAAATVN